MREIPLSTGSTVWIVAIAIAIWCCDFLCLVCSFGAVHAAIPWDGVLLAYGVAQIVTSLPVVPGGIGVVEGSLAVVLAAYGTGRVQALSVALMFRLVTFWLAIAVGWITFGVIAVKHRGGLRRVVPPGQHRAQANRPTQANDPTQVNERTEERAP